jgi:CubicO group peptidase (beta-lactamase class C family)
MKMKSFFVGLGALLLLLSTSCDNTVLCDPTPQFDIDVFIEEIQNRPELANMSAYQFAVNQNGNLYHHEARGNAIWAPDAGGRLPMTTDTRMHVASVSKFIGAIALMQVLEGRNISIDEPIHDHLPPRWRDAMHIEHYHFNSPVRVTFRALLRMETGIQFPVNNPGDSWDPGIMPSTNQMLSAISLPADTNRWGRYQNGNFTLIRVLIGELVHKLDATDPNYNRNTSDRYYSYLQQFVFGPLNLSPPLGVDEINNYLSGNVARGHLYPFDSTFRAPDNSLGWAAGTSPNRNGGSGGLQLSALDLAKVLAYFAHDNSGTLVSQNVRELILEHELGLTESMDGTGINQGKRYASKGGTRGPETGIGRAFYSRVVIFPNGVEAVLLTNCAYSNLGTILREAYEAAWVNPC